MTTILDNSHFPLQNNFTMVTNNNTNLCPFPPQIFDSTLHHHQQQNFGMGMGMGKGFESEFEIGSNPCSSSTTTTLWTNNNINVGNSMRNSSDFSSLFDQHCRELDLYLHFQGEALKEAIHKQKKQQMAMLLNKYQSRTMKLLKQKDEDLDNLKAKTKILEEFLKRKEEEKQVLQRIAKEKEQMVIELNNMLLLVHQNGSIFNKNEDSESVCGCEPEINGKLSHGSCKCCNSKEMRVVFLPCRHLCCCKECEGLLGFCPVCSSVKKASIEVLLS